MSYESLLSGTNHVPLSPANQYCKYCGVALFTSEATKPCVRSVVSTKEYAQPRRYMTFRVYAKHMFVGLLWVGVDGSHSFYANGKGGWHCGYQPIQRVKNYKQLNLRRIS